MSKRAIGVAHLFRISEKRVLSRVSDEQAVRIRKGRRKLRNEDKNNFTFHKDNLTMENEIGRTCKTYGSDKKCRYNFSQKRSWVYSVKILRRTSCELVDWT